MCMSGCVGREPNEIAYIVALGIDSADEGGYKITMQYANPTKISGGDETGKKEGNIVENIAVEAPNIYAALDLANQTDSKTFSMSHTKLVVFSQEVAAAGIRDMSELFIRSEELRPDVYLAVAVGSAGEYLEAVDPVMEINPAKYYQLIFDKNNIIGLPEGNGKDFFFGIETGDYDTLLPLAGVIRSGEEKNTNESDGNQKPKTNESIGEAPLNKDGFEYKMRDYIAGQNAIVIKSKTEAMGSAVFSGDKMTDTLGSIETELYKILSSDYSYSYITLYSEKTPDDPVTLKIIRKKNPRYDIDLENKKINVSIYIESEVYYVPSSYNIESDLENFEKNAQMYIKQSCEKFMRSFLEKSDSDIFRLNEKCKAKFLTNSDYYAYRDRADYRDFDVEVTVGFKVRRTGLVIREV